MAVGSPIELGLIMSLLPDEQKASCFVMQIGLARAYRLLDKITNRIERRYKRVSEKCFTQFDRGSVRLTSFEVDMIHCLKLGIQINDLSNTPAAARQRNLARRKARKMAIEQRRSAS